MSGVLDHVNVSLKLDAMLLNTLDLENGQSSILRSILSTLANGTGAAQASQMWSDTRTLTASATENLDLAGSLVNVFGVTLTFTKIKVLYVAAASGNTNDVQVSRGSSNGFVWFLAVSDGFKLQPGAWNCFFDPVGVAVTAGTGDILTVTNSAGGTSVTYDVVIVGTD